MATEYKYLGSKEKGRGSGPLILEGSIVNPKSAIEIGQTVELSDEQVKEYRERGLNFRKADGSEDEPKNATAGDSGTPETQEQQLHAQQPGQPENPTSGQKSGSQGRSK